MKKRNVKFRGISNVVRHAIADGEIDGVIRFTDVRKRLSGSKSKAPNSVIKGSLNHLARQNEIEKVDGNFYTKSTTAAAAPAKKARPKSREEVYVTGNLISVQKEDDGKMVAKVEVTSLQYK